MNESAPSLDDLSLFLAVAQSGSLTRAAERTGNPLPTLSRRMTKLEHSTGRSLFLRGKAGYALTSDGQALADEIADLDKVRRRVAAWHSADTGPRRIRITAGFWTSRLLAQNLDPTSEWTPEFVPSNAALDLARREADIGIRNRPPDHPWLARQAVRRIDYAVYGHPEAPAGFITLPKGAPTPPSQRWVHQTHPTEIRTTATDTRLCLDLALAGHGRIVLPTFVGDAEPLSRIGPPIPDLSHDEWLVSHNEARHDPAIRSALSAVARALKPDAAD